MHTTEPPFSPTGQDETAFVLTGWRDWATPVDSTKKKMEEVIREYDGKVYVLCKKDLKEMYGTLAFADVFVDDMGYTNL